MRLRTRIASAVAVSAVAGVAFTGTASAAPDFSDCPRTAPDVTQCIDVVGTAGTLKLNGTEIALGASFEIRGALARDVDGDNVATLVPPAGTTGLFTQPVAVPGGIARSSSTSPANTLTVQLKAAGPIEVNASSLDLRVPVKIKVKNALLGSCRLGSDAAPIVLSLPLTDVGAIDVQPTFFTYGASYADTAFAVPAAGGCNAISAGLVDWRFGLPAAAGSSALTLATDFSGTFGL